MKRKKKPLTFRQMVEREKKFQRGLNRSFNAACETKMKALSGGEI